MSANIIIVAENRFNDILERYRENIYPEQDVYYVCFDGVLYVAGALVNVVLLISNRFLGERIAGEKVTGIGLICLGVALLTMGA